jgi:hypothetical protein
MTTSILSANEQHAVFNDLDLLLVVRMALSSMTERDRTTLAAVERVWTEALETHGPGVVDLRVEEFANDTATRSKLVALLAVLETKLPAFGDEVPLSHLTSSCRIRGVTFERPYPTHYLLSATRRLRELIAQGK